MKKAPRIAVICHYELKPDRIGGMDRFFVAYDKACKEIGIEIDWFFSYSVSHGFYKDIHVIASEEKSAEEQFLNYSGEDHQIVITHFVELCTPFFKKIKERNKAFTIAVDHNPRPLQGFPLKKRLKNQLKSLLYSNYTDKFVGVSKYTVSCILKDYGSRLKKKTYLVYNGIDTSVYKKRTEENFGKILVASHLRESKGIQDLIEAVNHLPEKLKQHLEIDIFGEGPLEDQLKKKVGEYQLESQFQFRGSSSELPDLLQNYSFLLQPTYMECFSLSILESLAANVPVVTTPVGGNPEIIRDGINGYIFQPGDIEALGTILEGILTREISIEGEVNRRIEEDFNLQKMVENHINLLPCI